MVSTDNRIIVGEIVFKDSRTTGTKTSGALFVSGGNLMYFSGSTIYTVDTVDRT